MIPILFLSSVYRQESKNSQFSTPTLCISKTSHAWLIFSGTAFLRYKLYNIIQNYGINYFKNSCLLRKILKHIVHAHGHYCSGNFFETHFSISRSFVHLNKKKPIHSYPSSTLFTTNVH